MILKELKENEWFTLSEILYPSLNEIWIKGKYKTNLKKFEIYNFANGNITKLIAGKEIVYQEFLLK